MKRLNKFALILSFLLIIDANPVVGQSSSWRHFVAIKDAGCNLCAVAPSSSQLKTTKAAVECGFFCIKLSGCIGYSFYDNGTCELVTPSSCYNFYPVNSCKVSMDAAYYSIDGKRKSGGCPPGFDHMSDVDGCFKVIFQPLNWSSAGEACRCSVPGAHLVAITSAAKQNATERYLQQQFQKSESQICVYSGWSAAGKPVWTSGQTQDPNQCIPNTTLVWKTLGSLELPFDYVNWYGGNPDCTGGKEHCINIAGGAGYKWNDAPCDLLMCALCEV